MAYRIEFTPAADRQFRKLPRLVQERLRPAIDALAHTPRPAGAKKLATSAAYRVRVGNYRIVYEVQDAVLLVLVVTIGHRRQVYR